jgi:hypothetical protein
VHAEKTEAASVRQEFTVTVKAEDIRHLIATFDKEPWHLYKRGSGDQLLLVAKAKAMGSFVTAVLGPYELYRECLKLLDREPPLEPVEEVPKPPAEPLESPTELANLGPPKGFTGRAVEARPSEPTAQHAEPETPESEKEAEEETWGRMTPEEKLRRCAHEEYKFQLKKRWNTFALYAWKWDPERKKPKYRTIGPWNESLKKLAEELRLEIREPREDERGEAAEGQA